MYDKDKIKKVEEYLNELPILSVADELGIDVDIKGRCSCLLHEEQHPSMFIDIGKNKWNCFSCQHGGGVTNLISDYYQINLGALNYFDALSKFLSNHREITTELGFIDLKTKSFSPTVNTIPEVYSLLDKIENREKPTRLNIKLKPRQDADIADILDYLISIQTGR